MFVFCPFTAAKISPPEFPHKVFHGDASFSSAPTSPDCVACALCETNEDGKKEAECWELCRNATIWTMKDSTNSRLTPMIGVIYHNESFYFCNDEDHVLNFDIWNGSFDRLYWIRNTTETKPGTKYLPMEEAHCGNGWGKGSAGIGRGICGSYLWNSSGWQ